jgi:hypothetical protein
MIGPIRLELGWGNTIEFAPPLRKLRVGGLAILCAIAALAMVLVLLDWLLEAAQP